MNKELFKEMIEVIDQGYEFIEEYDNRTHQFDELLLYPVETHIIKIVGNHNEITTSEIARILNRTVSACSQILKRLEQKGLIYKKKNPHNNRKYHLSLSEKGKNIFYQHDQMEKEILKRYYQNMKMFNDEELKIYIRIQKALNQEYMIDIEETVSEID